MVYTTVVFTTVVFMALMFIMATSIMATSMATGSSRGGASLHYSMVRMPTRTPTRRTPIRILIMPGMRRLITDRIGLLSQLWHQFDHAPVLLVDLTDKDRATASLEDASLQDSSRVTLRSSASRLVLMASPLCSNSRNMGRFSARTSAINLLRPAARAMATRWRISALPMPRP